jgi:uncharacterized protein YjbI with pentapeptide repeats
MNLPLSHLRRFTAALCFSLSLCLSQPATFAQAGKDLRDKDFTGKDLSGQDFSGADLTDSTLKNAKLGKANLQGANLTDADLTGADFTEADLSGANLQDAMISGAYFLRANLSKANFRGTKKLNIGSVTSLRGTDLRKVELSGGASGIDFREADLRGARLKDVYSLADARIKRAKYDRTTIWPADFDPQQAGLTLVDDAAAETAKADAEPTDARSKQPAKTAAAGPASGSGADEEVSAAAGVGAKKPATTAPAGKPDVKAMTKALESFLVMLDNGKYDESFDAAAPSFREGLTKASWASNLKANRASLGAPTDRSAKKVDTKTDLTTGKKTFVIPVSSTFTKGAVTEEVTLVQDESGEFKVADYSIATQR